MGCSGTLANTDQAWLQERQEHPGHLRNQHISRRLLGRPGLQLVLGIIAVAYGSERRMAVCAQSMCPYRVCSAVASKPIRTSGKGHKRSWDCHSIAARKSV